MSMARMLTASIIVRFGSLVGCDRPSVESPNWEERRRAVERESDQAVLTRIVFEDEEHAVREAAVYRLKDEKTRMKVAAYDEHSDVASTAQRLLGDDALLVQTLLNDDDPALKRVAFDRLVECQSAVSTAFRSRDGAADHRLVSELSATSDRQVLSANLGVDPHVGAIARIRFFLTDPEVQRQLGKTSMTARLLRGSHEYTADPFGRKSFNDTADFYSRTVHMDILSVEVSR